MIAGEGRLRAASAVVASVGIAIATYIAIVESGGGAPACLAGGSGCVTVAASPYAHILGINVAVLGIAGYALLLGAALWRGDVGRFGGLFLAVVGYGFSMYLTYLELFTIEAICQWCVASAVVMTVLLLLNLARAVLHAGTVPRGAASGLRA